MRFKVTSVVDESCSRPLIDIGVQLEDWLNAALAGGDFGPHLDQFMVVFVAVDDDQAANDQRTEKWNRLSHALNPYTGQKVRSLCIAVPLKPSYAATTPLPQLLKHAAGALQQKLQQRPKRLPAGFDFAHLAAAMSAALAAYA